jgi:Ca2+-transporting ATPase
MNLVTDIFPAFALALEPPLRDRMRRAPRASATLLSRPFLITIAWQGMMLAAIALAAYIWSLGRYGAGAHARTIALMALVAVQMGHTFNCRSRVASAFTGITQNIYLWAATAIVVVLQALAVMVPPLRTLLGTVPMSRLDIIVIVACGLLPIAIVEVQKAVVRRRLS